MTSVTEAQDGASVGPTPEGNRNTSAAAVTYASAVSNASTTPTMPAASARNDSRLGFRQSLHQLEHAQKSGAGVPAYTRWVNRRLARVVAAAAAGMGLGPNTVTLLSAALSAAGLAVVILLPLSAMSGLAAAVLLAGGYVFDSADGQVARLTGRNGPAGEWLDHVVDAIRTPAIHLAVTVAVFLHLPEQQWLMLIGLAFAVLSAGQFMSQILAEQLLRGTGRPEGQQTGGIRKSFVLLPTDTGTVCWIFLLWGAPTAFAIGYAALFVIHLAHTGISMRRKYSKLVA